MDVIFNFAILGVLIYLARQIQQMTVCARQTLAASPSQPSVISERGSETRTHRFPFTDSAPCISEKQTAVHKASLAISPACAPDEQPDEQNDKDHAVDECFLLDDAFGDQQPNPQILVNSVYEVAELSPDVEMVRPTFSEEDIGVGPMGASMAASLKEAGFTVRFTVPVELLDTSEREQLRWEKN